MKTNFYSARISVLPYLLFFLLVILGACSTPFETRNGSYSFNYKGSWSYWESVRGYYRVVRYRDGNGCYVQAIPSNMVVFSFKMNNYTPPSKKERKRHKETDDWFEYEGIVTYYVTDQYPTAEAFSKEARFVLPDPRKSDTPYVKRTATARIRVSPDWIEDCPNLFNIWFDGIGVAISVDWG